VHAPGKNDPANLIAYGTANGRKWQPTATGPRRALTVTISGFPGTGAPLGRPSAWPASTGITPFSGTGRHAAQAMASEVSPGITLIRMTLATGAVLDLHPVTYHGVAGHGYQPGAQGRQNAASTSGCKFRIARDVRVYVIMS
jgi:hypothetical protein